MQQWFFLSVAIVSEVIGTSALPAEDPSGAPAPHASARGARATEKPQRKGGEAGPRTFTLLACIIETCRQRGHMPYRTVRPTCGALDWDDESPAISH